MADLTKLTPSKDLSQEERNTILEHFECRLASVRNTFELYADRECELSSLPSREHRRDSFKAEINQWAQALLENAWVSTKDPADEVGRCPQLDPLTDTSTGRLPKLPSPERLASVLNNILFLHVTTAKQYSARTRCFLSTFGPLDEKVVVSTLKNPTKALEEVQKQATAAKEQHADRNKTLRMVGVGIGAIAGGAVIALTGGLAAPLVGAGVTTILGWIGVGGTAAGLLASGLAGSSVVCAALFGAYGAKSTAGMVERYTREVRDIAIIPVREIGAEETLAVRLCVSGWLSSPSDVTAPWTVFRGEDTFALQWEMEALQALSNALTTLLKNHAMHYVKAQIIRQTIFATLMASLAPSMALLKIGQIIDNPWMNAKSLSVKTGAVLGDLLAKRVFGSRPITLTGYSLGSLVIFEALKYLSTLPTSETSHLIQDVFLYGSPIPSDPSTWSSIRRLVSGRLVNGYSTSDYVLAVLSRASDASWGVAGLGEIGVHGVENIKCEEVDGHTKYRTMLGKCLQLSNAPGIDDDEVTRQLIEVTKTVEVEKEMTKEEADKVVKAGLPEK